MGTSGKGLVGRAGAVLLRQCADRTGNTAMLGAVFPASKGPGWRDRGVVLVDLAVAVTLGAVCLFDIDRLAHQAGVFGDPPSASTARRMLDGIDETGLTRIGKGRAVVSQHVWRLLALRPGGFPSLTVAGKLLTGWVVIDLDATLVTAHSVKAGRRRRSSGATASIPWPRGALTRGSPWRDWYVGSRDELIDLMVGAALAEELL